MMPLHQAVTNAKPSASPSGPRDYNCRRKSLITSTSTTTHSPIIEDSEETLRLQEPQEERVNRKRINVLAQRRVSFKVLTRDPFGTQLVPFNTPAPTRSALTPSYRFLA